VIHELPLHTLHHSFNHICPTNKPRLSKAYGLAHEGLGYSPLEVALAWVRDADRVTSVILGARTGAQLRGALSSEEITLPDVVRSSLNEVSRIS